MKNPMIAAIASTPTATAIPMPVFAPLESPDGADVGVVDDELDAVGPEVDAAVEDEAEVEVAVKRT